MWPGSALLDVVGSKAMRVRAKVNQADIELLKTGFDDLEEDFAEEQFFAATRASYWKSPEGSAGRTLAATVIQKLEF